MPRYDDLAGRAVLVTGAAGGLGQVLAAQFAIQECRLALSDIDADALGGLCEKLRLRDEQRLILPADLGIPDECTNVVSQTISAFGTVDVLVNNAALLAPNPLEDVSVEIFDQVLAVNLRAPFLLARAVLPSMRSKGFGRIVNVASIGVRTGGAADDVVPYIASKGGLVALTKALARAAATYGVLVNAVLPAAIETPMLANGFSAETMKSVLARIPLGRLADPSEIAELIVWLASDAASFVTGASFDVNGGWVMT